jgi:pimeloyl-ACP methyl ester carboxylesterase
MRLVTTGPTLALDCHGPRSGRCVVLLHGLSGSRLTYHAVIDHLVRTHGEGIRIVAIDMRGHGESDRATLYTYDAASYATDIADAITQLTDRPALVVGHSLGGVVAASLALSHPDAVAGLFLEDPPLFEGDDARRNASPVAAFFPKLVAAVRDLQSHNAPPDAYLPLVRDTTPADEHTERCLTLSRWDPTAMEAAVNGIVWRNFDPLTPLPCPVTIVRADPACGAVFTPDDATTFRRHNPAAHVVEIRHAGHSIHATATLPAYLGELDRFIREGVS